MCIRDRYIDARLAPKVPQRRELGAFVLRDVRVFLNSIDHQLDLVRAAGVSARDVYKRQVESYSQPDIRVKGES